MKVAVAGSRSFNDSNKIFNILSAIPASEICSGGAIGADLLAKKYAINNGIKYVDFLPLFKTDNTIKYHPKWYFERNKKLVEHCDTLIAFWDGKSKGTKFTIDFAKKMGKDVVVIT